MSSPYVSDGAISDASESSYISVPISLRSRPVLTPGSPDPGSSDSRSDSSSSEWDSEHLRTNLDASQRSNHQTRPLILTKHLLLIEVPQPVYMPSPGLRRPFPRVERIVFSLPHEDPRIGVHMASLLNSDEEIKNSRNPVFLASGLHEIEFRILWPGYPGASYHRIVNLRGRKNQPITRDQLARYIAASYREFIQECDDEPVDEEMAHWTFKPDGPLSFENLWLIALRHVATNTYQAEIRSNEG
ncbi:uncharacterized protein FIBRA_05137 [Fibroporia radiculosa]|uniref:Uncharacterized protein n=1 Tax=Fibroporia radiculosa TaxID=599839 RepID=J4GQG2_9APHY|nr:uncharacterized protein FIBRA_05137 [Fibroporia radiculosa]CCM03020.1 predicted protein [Fibroporia radiculosa]